MFKQIWASLIVLGVIVSEGTILQAMDSKSVKSQKQVVEEKSYVEVKKGLETNQAGVKQTQAKSVAFSPVEQTQAGTPTLLWQKTFDDKIVSYSISATEWRTGVRLPYKSQEFFSEDFLV